jgi:hypothetical protein
MRELIKLVKIALTGVVFRSMQVVRNKWLRRFLTVANSNKQSKLAN